MSSCYENYADYTNNSGYDEYINQTCGTLVDDYIEYRAQYNEYWRSHKKGDIVDPTFAKFMTLVEFIEKQRNKRF